MLRSSSHHQRGTQSHHQRGIMNQDEAPMNPSWHLKHHQILAMRSKKILMHRG